MQEASENLDADKHTSTLDNKDLADEAGGHAFVRSEDRYGPIAKGIEPLLERGWWPRMFSLP